MDTNSGKKQRNKKNQQQNPQEANKQRTTQSATENKPDPQPQRVNRRQRNEGNKDKSPSELVSPPVTENKKTEEIIVIDHSNLKRETEDIAKLTKKFTKREITSNWHRYSAPEANVEIKNTDEDAPADFSDLLQVPVSRGGHLQLKEEQEWSNASRTELSGYFALDLKTLGQSLATIPINETLRLPKHLLTKEELSHFDALAEQAKQVYNPDKLEDPNTKVLEVLTNLIQTSADKESELKQSRSIKDLNNSDICLSNIKHSESSNEIFNSLVETNESKSLDQISINSNKDYIFNSSNPNEKQEGNKETLVVKCTTNVIGPKSKSKDIDLIDGSLLDTQEKQKPQFPCPIIKNHNILDNQPQNISQVSKESFIKDEKDVTLKQSEIKLSEPKEKRSSRRGTYKCQENVEVPVHKTTEKNKVINLDDDDDDLDSLLSLKQPISSQVTIKETAPAPVKESSVFPGVTTTSATPAKPSDLDDWLESVLQD